MKITKDFAGLVREENGDYILNDDLVCDENIEIELDDWLVVTGHIKAKGSIIANKTVKAGEGIEAGWGIKAGLGIEAAKYISAEYRIFAGTATWHNSQTCLKSIKCRELRKGEIAYGDLVILDKESEE